MSDSPEEICRGVRGAHETYCCGSHVRISEEGVTALTEPVVKSCPLHETLYGTKKIDAQTVQNSVGKKIQGFGF